MVTSFVHGALNVLNPVEVYKSELIMNISFFACSHAISPKRRGEQNRHIIFHALVALKLLVSLISFLVACSARILVNRQTDTQDNYCNPRCTCMLRVNKLLHV